MDHIMDLFSIHISRDMHSELHYHTDVEVIYVIEGSLEVKVKDSVFLMQKDDVLVLNSTVQHSLQTKSNSIVCSIKYDYQIMIHILKKPNSLFMCNSTIDRGRSYRNLQHILREIIYQESVGQHRTDSLRYSLLYRLLDELIENFLLDDNNPEVSENYEADEKLQLIIYYVHKNYQESVSLSALARQMYMSTSTLSRFFKKQTGTYFAEYVNQVRLRYAVSDLLYTEKNMTRIAADCGFSNASVFTKLFREKNFVSPTEFRRLHKGENIQTVDKDESMLKEIEKSFDDREEMGTGAGSEIRETIDMSRRGPLFRNWNEMINIGFIHQLQSANVQFHVLYLKKELNFRYGRLWMIFNRNTMVSDGETVGDYNYHIIFQALDFMVENHIRPWLDFTPRPDTNVKNVNDSIWFEDLRIRFQKKAVWEELLPDFLRHIVRRYGMEEVSSWKFEFGLEMMHLTYDNMPDLEQTGFHEVFTRFIRTIREIVPDAEVGFSAGAGVDIYPELGDVLTGLIGENCRPDFISFMLFPYLPIAQTEKQAAAYVRSDDSRYEKHELEKIEEFKKKYALENIKTVISEWNITVSNYNFFNDTLYRAARYLRSITAYAGNIEAFGLWMATDWACNSAISRSLISGGGGILTKDMIRKPIYYAVRFLNHLGSHLITVTENYIATANDNGEYYLVCFNPVECGSNYFLEAENRCRVDRIQDYFDMNAVKEIHLTLSGVDDSCDYYVKKRSIDPEHGSVIEAWGRFGNDSDLPRSDIKYLQESCVPAHSKTKVSPKAGSLSLSVRLGPEEFCALHIYPVF